MKNGKLYELLKSFSGHDYLRAEKFLASPFFNEDTNLLRMIRYFHELHDKREEFPADKEELYRKIFSEEDNYDEKMFRYRLSSLSMLLEDFISVKFLQQDSVQWNVIRQKAIFARSCNKSFEYVSALIGKELSRAYKDKDSLLQSYMSNLNLLEFQASRSGRASGLPFREALISLDKFYLSSKLKLSAEFINAGNVLSEENNVLLLDEARKAAAFDEFREEPSIAVYSAVVDLLLSVESTDEFERFYSLLKTNIQFFSPHERLELYHYLKNFCIRMINTGRQEFLSVLFSIYKMNLSDIKIFRDEFLSPWEYKNIVTLGLRQGEHEWVHDFIHGYRKFIEPNQQENAYLYNLGNWYFHQGRHSEMLKIFQQVEFTDLFYQLDTRSLLLKTYYETGEDEQLLYHASAFRVFLSRNKQVSSYQRKVYRNFISYTVKLFRSGTSKDKLIKLLDEVRSVRQIADLRWLEKKITELL
ncbi:MAG: hypothetical protein DWQ44_05460 [Bacteroidetes bacterium]|nr:MAG: hypothetical protein DWQ33_01045 [Bacteroidota bacterium]REK03470.1 MAG: hypothetical protein DWQ39_09735 [Bacteroidota bacterium]REK34775.1 MAG: hypothetical protein DWQ44_05460 [Bacteroidota bacterium]REK51346.1 MAG: hypothetical protein DWQ48_01690 [Bacteroidota bacterium]